MENSALSGTIVVDLTQHIAGPFCTKLLADFGAEVIKVEPPGKGDVARQMPPFLRDDPHPEKSGLFLYLNNNKYGITLDIERAEGKELLEQLMAQADILVESFPPGIMERLGLSHDYLQEKYPSLVITSITPFGLNGPYAQYKEQNIVLQALGGWMSKVGHLHREPLQAGGELGYFAGGYIAATGTAGALIMRNLTGAGQLVEVSLHEAHIRTMAEGTNGYISSGQANKRQPNWEPGILQTKNGYIAINILTQPHWEYLCEFTGTQDLQDDPRFVTNRDRRANLGQVRSRYEEFVRDKTKEDLFLNGSEMRIPMGLVYSAQEMLESELYREREFFVEVDHPDIGRVKQPGAPFKFSETPWRLRSPAPRLGQHNQEVLSRFLGLTPQKLAKLRELGIT